MTGPERALARALEDLTMQVNPSNVLAAHKVFRDHAAELQECLLTLAQTTQVGLCGGDPISEDAARAFSGKVAQLLEVHWSHQRELVVAADHLLQIARDYGFTEHDVERSLRMDPA